MYTALVDDGLHANIMVPMPLAPRIQWNAVAQAEENP